MEIKLQKKIDRAIAKVSQEPLNEQEQKLIEEKVISGMETWYIEEVKRQNLNYFRKKAYSMIKLGTELQDAVSTVETKLLL